jgi:hypothetical protein
MRAPDRTAVFYLQMSEIQGICSNNNRKSERSASREVSRLLNSAISRRTSAKNAIHNE